MEVRNNNNNNVINVTVERGLVTVGRPAFFVSEYFNSEVPSWNIWEFVPFVGMLAALDRRMIADSIFSLHVSSIAEKAHKGTDVKCFMIFTVWWYIA